MLVYVISVRKGLFHFKELTTAPEVHVCISRNYLFFGSCLLMFLCSNCTMVGNDPVVTVMVQATYSGELMGYNQSFRKNLDLYANVVKVHTFAVIKEEG